MYWILYICKSGVFNKNATLKSLKKKKKQFNEKMRSVRWSVSTSTFQAWKNFDAQGALGCLISACSNRALSATGH